MYYYGARYYDPRTSIWQSVDPMTEKMPGWSPYNYTANNPVRFIDPEGKIWKDPKDADRLTKQAQDKINDLNTDKADLKVKLDNKDKPLTDKERAKIEAKIADVDSRISSLEGSIADIKALGGDKSHTYQLVGNADEKNHVYKTDDGTISIQGSTDALHIHEIKHVARSRCIRPSITPMNNGQMSREK